MSETPHKDKAISIGQGGLEPLSGRSRSEDLRQLMTIAWPNVASTAAETVLSFVDYAIVSALGAAAQAAVSSGAMIYFSVFAMLLGTMVCVTTVVSQSFGAGRLRDCAAYGWQGIWLSLVFGAVGVLEVLEEGFQALGHPGHGSILAEVGRGRRVPAPLGRDSRGAQRSMGTFTLLPHSVHEPS